MNYFAIEGSMNTKIVGKIPHTKEVIHNCNVWDEPRFIDRMFFRKIEGIPIMSNAVLFPKAKLTDFIVTYGMGFGHGSMLISDKLKNILDEFNVLGLQYFKTFLIHKNEKKENYWQTHISNLAYEYIDFDKTIFLLKEYCLDGSVNIQELQIANLNDFLIMTQTLEPPKMLFIKSFNFNKKMNLDYFALRYTEDCHYGIVSEKLKGEIESQNITGIEFRPIEIPSQEWRINGEREKIYGKM
jgi:hypothetical protein